MSRKELQLQYFPEIDALRGAAALSVVIYHVVGHRMSIIFGVGPQSASIGPPYSYDSVLSVIVTTVFDGSAAVVLFFVISGFVLARSMMRAPLMVATSIAFLVRRIFRIMPSIWVSALVAWPPLLAFAVPPPSFDKVIGTAFLTDAVVHVNAVLWSIQVEMGRSALFPLLLWANLLGALGMAAVAGFSLWLCLTAGFQGCWIYMLAPFSSASWCRRLG